MHSRNLPLYTMRVHNAAMESVSYREVLAGNIRAARARAGLGQELVAGRMRRLGFSEWRYQTVGVAEKGKRRITAEEVMALAWVLQTSVYELMRPAESAGLVRFPAGDAISARSIALSATAHNDRAVTWQDAEPEFTTDSGEVSARVIVGPRFPPA